MSSNPFWDSKCESICPYCLAIFSANHAIRRFCPSKNDTANYCKNRFDNQIKHLSVNKANSAYKRDNAKDEYQRLYNIQVLNNIEAIDYTQLYDEQFIMLKYDMSIYDSREVVEQEPFYKINPGPFQLEWKFEKIITITKNKNNE